MKKGAAVIAFLLAGLGAAAAGASGSSSPAPVPPRPKPPKQPGTGTRPEPAPEGTEPYWVQPGWYWWFLDWSKDGAAYVQFQKEHYGYFEVRKVLGYAPGGNYSVIIFEIVVEPVAWTLPGIPNPAPKGIDTELSDIESAPAPEDFGAWRDYLEQMATQTVDQMKAYDRAFQEWLDGLLRFPL